MKEQIESTVAQLKANSELITNAPNLYKIGRANGLTCKQVKETFLIERLRVGRGQYDVSLLNEINFSSLPDVEKSESQEEAPAVATRQTVTALQKTLDAVEEVFIPPVDPTFVPWGEYKTIRDAIKSGEFFPIYISGLSGNGKTMMVEQACAKAKREYVRVQISPETDESDLIGGFRLIDGETVFYKGPVVKAMERGAVLLIDELDRGTNKIMCLQGVLEGKPILLKKIGQIIHPAPGFTVIATANTKGSGSEDGRFSAATVIDEAFLERFIATIDQPYPSIQIERNIVMNHMVKCKSIDDDFAEKLVNWSDIIRKTFADGGVDDLISTRRLCHIVKSFSIYKDRSKAISMCIARFDSDTAAAFIELYQKIDETVNETSAPVVNDASEDNHDSDYSLAAKALSGGWKNPNQNPNPQNQYTANIPF